MQQLTQSATTGIECLRGIASNFCRDINFDALLTGENLKQEADAPEHAIFIRLAKKLGLESGASEQPDWQTAYKDYSGPLIVKLKNGNWVCVINSAELNQGKEQTALFDPLAGGNKILMVPADKLAENYGGITIKFKNLIAAKESKNSGLFCITAVGRHHAIDIDVRRLLHEYAVENDEITEKLLIRIIHDYNMKVKKTVLGWEKLANLGEAFPAIAEKHDGKYIILCGFRKSENAEQLVVIDPSVEKKPGENFLFWSREGYENSCTGKVFLLKRIYSLMDEKQPFGLRWFIPEFIKLKAVFGQIAIAVLIISAISLITPLFFQIVVDKVLVHESYNTLNVLGVGIIIALCFNSLIEYLRGYLLLFATNKIDIRTATKTFDHLMGLPVNFFEKMSAGVLIKHMQQTEKIRGFLAGNLFFTILELFSLVIFIPFMLLYSVKLTLIVLGFTA
ncbi:MAG: ABC transporter transmembrane domain-containing protein, partial [Victivallaceae bacterium]